MKLGAVRSNDFSLEAMSCYTRRKQFPPPSMWVAAGSSLKKMMEHVCVCVCVESLVQLCP